MFQVFQEAKFQEERAEEAAATGVPAS